MKINHGVLLEQPNPKDWIAGANSKIEYQEVCEDWKPYLPTEERQKDRSFETSGCVSFSLLNCIETQLNFFGEPFNFSDRFLVIASKTHPEKGNTQSRVAETFRLRKSCDELKFRFEIPYYTSIPTQLYVEAQKTLPNHDPQFEFIGTDIESLKKHVKQSPLSIIVNTGENWKQEVVTDDGGDPNHAVTLYGITANDDYLIFDHYQPFQKVLYRGYKIWSALKPVITKKAEAELWQVGDVIGVAPATPEALIKLMNAVNLPYTLKADGSLDFPSLDIKKTIK